MSKKDQIDFDSIPEKTGIGNKETWDRAKVVAKAPAEWMMKNMHLLFFFIATLIFLGLYAIVSLFIEHTQGMCLSSFIYLFGVACYSWWKKRKK